MRHTVRKIVETLTGCDISWHGGRSIIFVDKRRRKEAWFSHKAKLRSIFNESNIDLVVDVGANEGQFAVDVREFYSGEIISFEPTSAAFEKLSKKADKDDHWQVHKLALGNKNSELAINVYKLTTLSSFLNINEYGRSKQGTNTQQIDKEIVTIHRLDEIIDELGINLDHKKVFLKLDTQGYDKEVFKGLGDKQEKIAALQTELSVISYYEGISHWTENIDYFEQAGFSVIGLFPVLSEAGRAIEYDALMERL